MISERYPNVGSLPVKCDVSKEDEIKATVDQAVDKFGRLDIMVSPLAIPMEASRRVRAG